MTSTRLVTLLLLLLGRCRPSTTNPPLPVAPRQQDQTAAPARGFTRLFEVTGYEGRCSASVSDQEALALTVKNNGSIRLHAVNGSRTIAELGHGEQSAIGKLAVVVRPGPLLRLFDHAGTLLEETEHGLPDQGGLASDAPYRPKIRSTSI